jgi:hypothetical protein
MITPTGLAQQTNPATAKPDDPLSSEEKAIQQIEVDLLSAERNIDPAVINRIFSEDWVNLTPTGLGSSKPAVLGNYKNHSGVTPPYSVDAQDMRIYILGDSAVAAYVKVYKAKENGNVAHQDITDIFTKMNGVWKVRVSRTSPHAEQ